MTEFPARDTVVIAAVTMVTIVAVGWANYRIGYKTGESVARTEATAISVTNVTSDRKMNGLVNELTSCLNQTAEWAKLTGRYSLQLQRLEANLLDVMRACPQGTEAAQNARAHANDL